MTNQHPITPPPELVEEWVSMLEYHPDEKVLSKVARWGADQELKACCVLMDEWGLDGEDLVECRRPKPPTLKEQAQAELDRLIALIPTEGAMAMAEPIRRAIEALPDS
jgi:hypothetical protein